MGRSKGKYRGREKSSGGCGSVAQRLERRKVEDAAGCW